MLLKHQFDNRTFWFVDKDFEPLEEHNIFTIIVGKNGTGKSRLLSAIAKDCFNLNHGRRNFGRQHFREVMPSQRIVADRLPTNVICMSTSPFDKFPLLQRTGLQPLNYSYLGLRGLPSLDFGKAYLSKVMVSLMAAVMEDWEQMAEIVKVLNYLGYTDRIKIRLRRMLIYSSFDKFMHEQGTVSKSDYDHFLRYFGHPSRNIFKLDGNKIDEDNISHFVNIINSIGVHNLDREIIVDLSSEGFDTDPQFTGHIRDLLFLVSVGFFSIKDISLEKYSSQTLYSISDASSGEQCVVMSILALAGQIKHGSLVLIDEPEICLHPEWQERYIKMLMETFRYYRGCHFIIATHSPQIVANLESENCFVLSMEDRKVTNAAKLSKNSVDFQLAQIFNSPGFKNEYLSRIAMNTFARVGKQKAFSDEDVINLQLLNRISSYLNQDDPVLEIIDVLREMKEYYA